MEILYPALLFAIAALTMLGVLSEHFDDNLMQRIGMSLVCMASVLQLYSEFIEVSPLIDQRSRWLLSIGVLIYALGTARHAYKRHQRIRNRIAQQ